MMLTLFLAFLTFTEEPFSSAILARLLALITPAQVYKLETHRYPASRDDWRPTAMGNGVWSDKSNLVVVESMSKIEKGLVSDQRYQYQENGKRDQPSKEMNF